MDETLGQWPPSAVEKSIEQRFPCCGVDFGGAGDHAVEIENDRIKSLPAKRETLRVWIYFVHGH
jgi:hypothetical protein